MLETFGEYMYYLLSTPFKQARKARNQWYIYFKVTGRLFDEKRPCSGGHGRKAW